MKLPRKLKKELKKGFERRITKHAPVWRDGSVFAGWEEHFTTKAKRKTKAFHKLVRIVKREELKFFQRLIRVEIENTRQELSNHHKMNSLMDGAFSYAAKKQLPIKATGTEKQSPDQAL